MGLVSRLVVVFVLCVTVQVRAHGERPLVVALHFTAHSEDTPWLLTDNQGVFARPKDNFRWLCEDAINPSAALRSLYVDEDEPLRWAIATDSGLFWTDDGGCYFRRAPAPLGRHRLIGLWSLDDGLFTASANPATSNGVWRSLDDGATWAQVWDLGAVRARDGVSGSSVLYVSHGDGLLVIQGNDGVVEHPWPQNHVGQPVLLGVHPRVPETLFLALEALPQTHIMRSIDGGASWVEVLQVPDLGLGLVSDSRGDEFLIYGPLGNAWRSDDGGRHWVEGPSQPPGLVLVERAPWGERLYGSTDVYGRGPWALGHSDDFGRSWTQDLVHFTEAVERWDCEPRAHARACCRGLCPGLPPGSSCPGVAVGVEDCGPRGGDAGTEQSPEGDGAEMEMGSSAGTAFTGDRGGAHEPLADAMPVSTPSPRATGLAGSASGGGGGCATGPPVGPSFPWHVPVSLFFLLGVLGRGLWTWRRRH